MNSSMIIGIAALCIAAISGGAMIWYLMSPKKNSALGALKGQGTDKGSARSQGINSRGRVEPNPEMLEELKHQKRKKMRSAEVVSLEDKFFQAGMFSEADRREFFMMRTFGPVVLAPIAGLIGSYSGIEFALAGAILGAAVGMRLPYIMLDKRIAARHEDILFYLPLVIEQVVIGVSSSLDIGPCLQRVVSMADERDSHNCVTELVKITQHYIASGGTLEDALVDIGRRSGHTELKHAFMSLSQVAKHGGEVTKQLQELADAVSNQREAKIETKIKKLELEATVPVAVVFCGFLLIIISGFGIQIKNSL
jgi:Flp pilus assembly protein TadB